MAEYPAGRISRAGKNFNLLVDDDGNWLSVVESKGVKAPTRAKLISEIDRVLRLEKKAVHVPFTRMESNNNGYVTLKHGVATGVHSGTGNLLVAWDDGTNGQLTAGFGTEILKRLTPDKEQQLARFSKEAYESSERLREFIGRMEVYKGARGLVEQIQAELKKGGGK